MEHSDFSFSWDHATLVPVFEYPSIVLGVAAVPGDALVTYEFEESNIKLMAYARTEQNCLYLLVLRSRSPGLHAVTVLNTQTVL